MYGAQARNHNGNEKLVNGDYFITEMGFQSYDRDYCLSVIPIFTIIFAALGFLSLRFINWEER